MAGWMFKPPAVPLPGSTSKLEENSNGRVIWSANGLRFLIAISCADRPEDSEFSPPRATLGHKLSQSTAKSAGKNFISRAAHVLRGRITGNLVLCEPAMSNRSGVRAKWQGGQVRR
jgi:hypothetical protein